MAGVRGGRRSILVVAAVAVVMAAGGFFAARLVISPEDAAARTAAPVAAPITVPVESKQLDADIVTRGDIGFSDAVQVELASGGSEGAASIVTGRLPEVGSVLENGTVMLEVTGRPVIALSGQLPTYRSLVYGSTGPDVEQLEATLAALGGDPGPLDQTYDAATGAAVAALYAQLGYPAPQPGDDVLATLATARSAAETAAQAVAEAQRALTTAEAGPATSERFSLRAAVDAAQAAYDTARQTPSAPDASAVATATGALDTATAQFTALTEALAAAADPAAAADLAAQLEQARQAMTAAQTAVDTANRGGAPDAAAVAAAKSALDVAKAQRTEALTVDTATEQAAVTAAQQAADAAQADLVTAQAAATTPLPAQEVVWLASMPRRVDEVLVSRGATVDGAVLAVSGADLAVTASVSAEEAALLKTGLTAELTIPGGAPIAAVVTEIGGGTAGAPPADEGADTPAATGTGVTLEPQDVTNEQAQALRGANVKVTIPVASTSGAVLVVPVAALFSDADGTPRVEVMDDAGTTRFQPVRTGLSTGGEVEVSPVDDQGSAVPVGSTSLQKDSLVVVGR